MDKFSDIPTGEIWQDLKDNDTELLQLRDKRSKMIGYDRLAVMRIRAVSSQITEHEILSKKIRKLLKARGEKVMV